MVETTYGTRAAMPALVELENIPFEGFLVRRRVVEVIGLPDPSFFIFYDDVDFALRARRAGFHIYAVRDAVLVRQLEFDQQLDLAGWKGYYMYRNLFTIHLRYGENALVRAKPWLITAGVVALSPLRGGRAEARNVRRALRDARAGARGRAAVTRVAAERRGRCPSPLEHAQRWLDSLDDRPVPPQAQVEELVERLGTALPDGPQERRLGRSSTWRRRCEPGLTAMPSGRFYGMVIGGTHPAALAADWLVSAWDQNAGLARLTPAATATEQVASAWLLDLLGLPEGSAVGFVTGGTMANFTCLAAGRDAVLRASRLGRRDPGSASGAPGCGCWSGEERHDTVDLALRYLGLGAPEPVRADEQGRLDARRPRARRSAPGRRPTMVCLQAGNVHSGGYDPFAEAIEVAHRHGAWVHVDGAFGLFAAAAPAYRHLTEGIAGADSWATDAHKTLNVPYDCGIAIVRDPAAVKAAMGMHGDYLIQDAAGDPSEKVPELSRRARSVPV